MTMWPVSTRVNSPDDPSLAERWTSPLNRLRQLTTSDDQAIAALRIAKPEMLLTDEKREAAKLIESALGRRPCAGLAALAPCKSFARDARADACGSCGGLRRLPALNNRAHHALST